MKESQMMVAAMSNGVIEAVTRVKTGWKKNGENGTETFLFDSDISSQDLSDNTEAWIATHIDLTLNHQHFVECVSMQELESRNGAARSHF